MAKERGKLVSISLYEIFQDHVYDLLDPKQLEVHVLEDAQGKIKLKGLSHVSVNSIPEFHRLYFTGCSSHKSVQRVALEMPRRSHRGLIIHIGSNDENSNTKHVSKMNFVDLAGYEDPRRKSTDNINLVEITRINKSLYALLNVVYALNVNENRVPFRESKLTRMLQDSFGGKNDELMLTCLNPSLSQDTIYTTSLAARSCQGVNRNSTGSTKKIKGESQPMVHSSLKKGKLDTVSSTAKKQTGSQVHFSAKNGNCMVKGRKLFDEGNHLISSKQAKSPPNIASAMQTSFLSIEPSLREVEQSISDVSSVATCQEVEETISDVSSATISKEEVDGS